jgi:hypothetical protein
MTIRRKCPPDMAESGHTERRRRIVECLGFRLLVVDVRSWSAPMPKRIWMSSLFFGAARNHAFEGARLMVSESQLFLAKC